jgi:hypothetical protein
MPIFFEQTVPVPLRLTFVIEVHRVLISVISGTHLSDLNESLPVVFVYFFLIHDKNKVVTLCFGCKPGSDGHGDTKLNVRVAKGHTLTGEMYGDLVSNCRFFSPVLLHLQMY